MDKRWIWTLGMTLVTVSLLSAQQGGMMGGGMHGMMMGGVKFPHLLMKAQRMAPDKAQALQGVATQYMPMWIRQMAEVHVAAFQLGSVLRDSTAPAREIQTAYDKLIQERRKLETINRDAILKLRDALGAATFARLLSPGSMEPSPMPSMPMMKMMQMMKPMNPLNPMHSMPPNPMDKEDEE